MFYLNKTINSILREYDSNVQEYEQREGNIFVEILFDKDRDKLLLNTVSGAEPFAHNEPDTLLEAATERLQEAGCSMNSIYFHMAHDTFVDIPAEDMTHIEVIKYTKGAALRIAGILVALGNEQDVLP